MNRAQHIMELAERAGCYSGSPLETGGTSIQGNAAPAIRDLFKKGVFKPGMKILDYGAGKYARNADFLRDQGLEVFAYDPFNGSPVTGWKKGEVSNKVPSGVKFDVAFTSFVLNVVPCHTEKELIKDVDSMAKTVYHITRNMDIFDSVKKALNRQDKIVGEFFLKHYAEGDEIVQYADGSLSDKVITDFCKFGVQTSRGFQRIPFLDQDHGFSVLRKTSGFKVFKK